MKEKIFRAIFALEGKRFICKRNAVIFIVFFLLLLGFAVDGIIAFKSTLANKEVFQETEQVKVSQYVLISQYGTYGIRLMLIPAPMSVLFNNSTVFDELISNVDTGERLNIYTPFKGKSLFSLKSSDYMDFSGIIIIIGAILALLYGYDTFRNKNYLKWLSNYAAYKKVIASLIIVRLILVNTFFLLLATLSLLIILLFGIDLVNLYFLYFVFEVVLVITFFTCFGFFTGTLKRKAVQVTVMIVFYFCFIFLIPWTVNKIVSIKANSITSNYMLELKKLKIMMVFERRFYEKAGIFYNGIAPDKVKQLIKEGLKNEHPKIRELEDKMKYEMHKNINIFQMVANITPITFYISSNYELSSKGFSNFIKYYSFCKLRKKQFINFYVVKKFYSKADKIESFIKGDMNLFYSKSNIMEGWWTGILLTILYIIVLITLTYKRLIKSVLNTPGKYPEEIDGIDISIKNGEDIGIHTDRNIVNSVFNLLYCGSMLFPVKISVDGVDISSKGKIDFMYLGSHQFIPGDMTPLYLIAFLKTLFNLSETDLIQIKKGISDDILKKKFGDMNPAQKARMLFNAAAIKKSPIYLFDDFFNNLPGDSIKGFEQELKALKKNGGLLIYLTTTSFEFIPVTVDRYAKIYLENEKYVYKEFSRNKTYDRISKI